MTENVLVGLTYITAMVTGPLGERSVDLLIDTGAQYSLLPTEVWKAIGLTPHRTRIFHLADGTPISRAVSECVFELPEIGGETPRGHSPVILGEPGDVALLGVITLESLALVFNPFDRSLRLMLELPLMSLSA
jgi:predicted aspartyl protease